MGHPLRVYYPHGGRHFVLRWWCENEQEQLLLARSRPALDAAVHALLTKPDRRNRWWLREILFRDLLEVDIVAPPAALCEMAAAEERRRLADEFVSEVTWEVSCAVGAGVPPAPFGRCRRYRSRTTMKLSAADRAAHRYCDGCVGGVRLVGMKPELFYETFAEQWAKLFPRPVFIDKGTSYSRAPEAKTADGLNAAVRGTGQSGIQLGSLAGQETMHPVLFYYRLVALPPIDPYAERLAAAKLADQQAREEADRQGKNLAEQKRARKAASVLALFAPQEDRS